MLNAFFYHTADKTVLCALCALTRLLMCLPYA